MPKKKDIWTQIRQTLASSLPKTEYRTWFSRASLKKASPDGAVIEVPNKFFAEWFQERYLSELESVFKKVYQKAPKIEFTYPASAAPPENRAVLSRQYPDIGSGLDPSKTFERFVTCDFNRFAQASSTEVAKGPSLQYNPLYIYGGPGLGKTHLLHAIGNSVKHTRPDIKVRYLTSQSLSSHFTLSLKQGRLHEFREGCCGVDLLLFDDVHLLEQKKRTQEEFLFLYNNLYNGKKQIVITGDSPPNKLNRINPELVSRLGWGLLTEIREPNPEEKIEIIKSRCREDNLQLPDDVIFFLAKSSHDMKTLFVNLARIETYASLNNREFNLSLIQSLFKESNVPRTGIQEIKNLTAGFFNISPKDLVSKNKKQRYAYPRQIAMYLARKHTQLSFKELGMAFGNRNHSTVIHAVRRIKKEIKNRKELQEDLERIDRLLV